MESSKSGKRSTDVKGVPIRKWFKRRKTRRTALTTGQFLLVAAVWFAIGFSAREIILRVWSF